MINASFDASGCLIELGLSPSPHTLKTLGPCSSHILSLQRWQDWGCKWKLRHTNVAEVAALVSGHNFSLLERERSRSGEASLSLKFSSRFMGEGI